MMTVPQAEEGDWRKNFAAKSSDISQNLLAEDSGYVGLDSSFTSFTSSTPSTKEPREKQSWWEKLQRSTGDKSTFFLEEPRVRCIKLLAYKELLIGKVFYGSCQVEKGGAPSAPRFAGLLYPAGLYWLLSPHSPQAQPLQQLLHCLL